MTNEGKNNLSQILSFAASNLPAQPAQVEPLVYDDAYLKAAREAYRNVAGVVGSAEQLQVEPPTGETAVELPPLNKLVAAQTLASEEEGSKNALAMKLAAVNARIQELQQRLARIEAGLTAYRQQVAALKEKLGAAPPAQEKQP